MSKKIFVNLPVKNLSRSMEFFKTLGYSFDHQFTNEMAACMIIDDDIYVMLLTEEFFKGFIPGQMNDANKSTETVVCLSCESRTEVDETVQKAVKAGAKTFKEPQDYGFMYGHGFQDLDGHVWEYMWMSPSSRGNGH